MKFIMNLASRSTEEDAAAAAAGLETTTTTNDNNKEGGDDTCSSSDSSLNILQDDGEASMDDMGARTEDEEDDDLMDLSGTIPVVSDNNNKPTIHYLGREYKVEEAVLQSIDSSLHRPDLNSGSSHHRSRAAATAQKKMGLSNSEHLSDRWSRFAEEIEASLPKLSPTAAAAPPTTAASSSSAGRRSRRHTAATATNNRMSQSEHIGSTRRSSVATSPSGVPVVAGGGRRATVNKYIQLPDTTTATKKGMSQSEFHFGGGRRASANAMSLSEHYRSTRRGSITATDYLKNVGKKLGVLSTSTSNLNASKYFTNYSSKPTSEQQDKWGFTQQDLEAIINDPVVFAKLQRDLRARHAVTDNIIKQRLHVFVHNTKDRKMVGQDDGDNNLNNMDQRKMQEEYEQDQRERMELQQERMQQKQRKQQLQQQMLEESDEDKDASFHDDGEEEAGRLE